MVSFTADAEQYAALESKARELSAQLPADPSEWPKGWVFQFHTVLAFRAWERECTYRSRRKALGLRSRDPRPFADYMRERERALAARPREER